LDGALYDLCAVHRRRDPQAVPVNHRRLGQPVREFDLEWDALLRFQDGTGHLTVESIAADFAAGSNLPIDFTRLQTVPDDTSRFQCCSLFAVHALPPLRFDGRWVGHYRADACMASGRPTPSSGR